MVRHRHEPAAEEKRPGSAFTCGEGRRRRWGSRRDSDDSEGYATLAYLDSEDEGEGEEEEREIVWKKKTTTTTTTIPKKIAVRAREREEEVDWDRRDVRNRRQQVSIPQHGLPPSTTMRSGSTPGTRYSDGYESDDYHPSRSVVVSGKQQDRQYRDERELERHAEREPPRNRGAGLPQPPAMVREVAGGGAGLNIQVRRRLRGRRPPSIASKSHSATTTFDFTTAIWRCSSAIEEARCCRPRIHHNQSHQPHHPPSRHPYLRNSTGQATCRARLYESRRRHQHSPFLPLYCLITHPKLLLDPRRPSSCHHGAR